MIAHIFARSLPASALFAAMLVTAAAPVHASVEISSNPTHNMNCTGGVCTPTAKNADLNAVDLANMLASGDVKVVTGSGAVTITVSSSFSWTSTHRLTLDAYYNVSFRAPVVVAGQGAVTITYNDGGTGGDLIFFDGASLDFWDAGSSLIIGGHSYKLEKRLGGLADDIAANPHGLFALANNYDAARRRPYREPPIPTSLIGSFEGLGHTIFNLDIEPKDTRHHQVPNVGLFAGIAVGGFVRDILIANGKIVTHAQQVSAGLLAAYNGGLIINSSSAGSVELGWHTRGGGGGLVGSNSGTIENSHSSTSIGGSECDVCGGLAGGNTGVVDTSDASGSIFGGVAGGLVGYNNGNISNSHASGATNCGGLVCANFGDGKASGVIRDSYATGAVVGQTVGGLVGISNALISGSYTTGSVAGNYTSAAGGLVGFVSGGTIENSYAMGSVSGGSDYEEDNGGLVGYQYSYSGGPAMIQNSYATGNVTGPGNNGGILGANVDDPSGYLATYWDMTTSQIEKGCGRGSCSGITGLTDAQLKSGLPVGFDPNIWGQNASINNGYPYLLANPPQ